MYIKHVHISSFGPLVDRDYDLSRGLNVLFGSNESGKTSLVTFIKFILYGLPTSRGAVGEKQKYVNRRTGEASGYATVVTDDGEEIRIERKLSGTGGKAGETVTVVNGATGVPIPFSGSVGEFLLGVPEQVFVNTAFVGQQAGARPDDEPLKRSVENIASAADEKVNVKKALEQIDRARIAILYKNKNGGKLFDLEEKRRKLYDLTEADKACAEETVETEAALSEIKQKLAAREKSSEEYDKLFYALDVLSKKRLLDAAEKCSDDLEKIVSELDRERSGCDLENCEASAAMCERNLDAVDAAYAKFDSIPSPDERFIPDEEDGDFGDSPIEDIGKAERLRSRSSSLRVAGVLFIVAAVLGGIFSAVLATVFSAAEWFYVAAGSAVFAAFGVAFFAFSSKAGSDLSSILDAWDAPSVDELVDAVKETVRAREENVELLRQKEAARADMDAAERAADESGGLLAQIAETLAVDAAGYGDDREVLGAVKDEIGKRKARIASLESEKATLDGRFSALREQTAGFDAEQIRADAEEVAATETGKRAAGMGQNEVKEAAMKRDFCHGSVAQMKDKETELDRRLIELKAKAKTPADTAEKLERLDAVIEELRTRHDAYVTAYEALVRAGENMRTGVLPSIKENASEMMREISGGKYSELSVSSGMDLFCSDGGDTLGVGYLSSGTEDAAYLSLRLALIRALFPEDKTPPAIFDESFARIDEGRLDSAIRMISSESFGLQSILCTCREEEAKAAERHGGRVIRM